MMKYQTSYKVTSNWTIIFIMTPLRGITKISSTNGAWANCNLTFRLVLRRAKATVFFQATALLIPLSELIWVILLFFLLILSIDFRVGAEKYRVLAFRWKFISGSVSAFEKLWGPATQNTGLRWWLIGLGFRTELYDFSGALEAYLLRSFLVKKCLVSTTTCLQ